MKIYVAGPMRGYEHLNFPAFAAATAQLRSHGYEVISPAEEDLKEGFDPDNPGEWTEERYEAWMARDFERIDECDCICMLPGWKNSPGARREHAHAIKRGKIVLIYEEGPQNNWWIPKGD